MSLAHHLRVLRTARTINILLMLTTDRVQYNVWLVIVRKSRKWCVAFFSSSFYHIYCAWGLCPMLHIVYYQGNKKECQPEMSLQIRSTWATAAIQAPCPHPSVGAAWHFIPSLSMSSTLNKTLSVLLSASGNRGGAGMTEWSLYLRSGLGVIFQTLYRNIKWYELASVWWRLSKG